MGNRRFRTSNGSEISGTSIIQRGYKPGIGHRNNGGNGSGDEGGGGSGLQEVTLEEAVDLAEVELVDIVMEKLL